VGSRWLVVLLAGVVAVPAACALRRGPSIPDLVNSARPLTPDETARVLGAVRAAIAGKHGWLTSAADEAAGRPGTEFTVAPNGRLQFLRGTGGMIGGTGR
jgi:hypothetical protein